MSRYLKIVLANIIVLIFVVGGAAIAGFYIWERSQYITTDDARVSANLVTVTALMSGKLTAWNVRPGDRVSDNSAIGSEQAVTTGASGAAGSKAATPTGQAGGTATGGTSSPAVAGKLDIRAPIGGTIIQSMVEQGQTVMPGQTLAMMADLNKLFIVANIEENRIEDVERGQSVDISIDAFPGTTFNGRVRSVVQATSSTFSLIPTSTTSGSYTKVVQKIPVQISIDRQGKNIFPGMSATVKIKK